MKNKKGFTLIELLAVVIILGILLLLAVPAITKYLKRGTTEYYHSIENEIKSSGMDYLETYRTLLPRQIGNVTVIELDELVNNKYIDEVVDEDGNKCSGTVTVKKVKTDGYEYYSCLKCNDKYESSESSCDFSEEDNFYEDQDDYNVLVDKDYYEVEQGNSFTLPYGKVYYKDELVNDKLEGRPNKVDTNKLGETDVKYSYHGVSKIIKVKVIDKTSPSVPEVVLKKDNETGSSYVSGWYSGNIYQKFKSTDYMKSGSNVLGSGIKEYQISSDGIKFKAITGDSIIDSDDGIYKRYVKSIDKSGNISSVKEYTFKIDKTEPLCGLKIVSGTLGKNGWYLDDVSIDFASKTDKTSSVVDSNIPNNKITTEGKEQILTGTVKDEAGNIGSCEIKVSIDKTNPEVNYNVKSGTYSDDQTLTVTANDKNYSYMDIKVYKNGALLNTNNNIVNKTKNYSLTNGKWIVYTKAYDLSGRVQNQNPSKDGWYYQEYVVDTDSPACSLKVTSGTLGSNGWYTSDVTVDFESMSDDVTSVVDSNIINPTVTTEGKNQKVEATVTDEVGNIGTCEYKPINIDKTDPEVKYNVDSGTYKETKSLTVTASDTNYSHMEIKVYKNGSLLKTDNNITDKTKTYSLTDGEWKIDTIAYDLSGRVDTNSQSYVIDTKVPTCSLKVVSGTLGKNSWYTSNVTVDFDTKDGTGTEIDTATIDKSTVSTEGTTTVTGTIKDKAGNENICTISVKIDKTDPEAKYSIAGGTYKENKILTVTASDTNYSKMNIVAYKNGEVFDTLDVGSRISQTNYMLTDGEWKIDTTVYDLSGRVGTNSQTYVIDTKEPTCSLKVTNGTLRLNNWYTSNVTVDFDTKDGTGTEISTATIDKPTVTEEGITIVTGTVTDKAGNENTCSIEIKLDKTNPNAVTGLPDGGNYDSLEKAHIYNKEIDVTVSARDTNYSYMDVKVYKDGSLLKTDNNISDKTKTYSLTDGEWEIDYVAYDLAGNSEGNSDKIIIDTKIPTCSLKVTSGTLGKNGWYTSDVTVDFETKDGTGTEIDKFVIDKSTVTEEGTTKITGTVTDKAGNENKCTISIKIDKTNPKITYNIAGGTYSVGQTLTVTASDTNYSYMDIKVYKDGSLLKTDSNITTKTKTYDLTDGEWKIDTTAYDLSGRLGTKSQTYIINTKMPTCSLKVTSGTKGENDWYTSDVTVDFETKDAIEIDTATTVIDKSTVTNEGTTTVTGTVTDKYGNKGECSITVKIDKAKPTCSLKVTSGTLGKNNWYLGNVTVDFDKKDGTTSEIAEATIDKQTVTTEGTTKVTGTVKDEAGNVGTCDTSISIDPKNPTINYNVDNGTYSKEQSLTVTASDTNYSYMDIKVYKDNSLSKTDSNITTKTKTYSLTDGTWKIDTTAYDLSGRSTNLFKEYLIDTKAPTCSLKVISGTLGENGWYTSDVTVGFDKTDGTGSNIEASFIESATLTSTGKVVASVTDEAGNIGTCESETIYIDKTAPSCTWSGENTTWTSSSKTIKVECSDETSQCDSTTLSKSWAYSSGTTKTASLSYEIKDQAGNVTTCSKTANVYVDKDAPSIPTNGAIGDVSGSNATGTIQTAASGSTDTGSGEITYRYLVTNTSSTPSKYDSLVATSNDGNNKYTTSRNFGRSCGKTYYAWAIAVDKVGNRSDVKYLGTTSDGVDSYSGWSECSKKCGGGVKTRTNTCQLVTAGLSQSCNTQDCCSETTYTASNGNWGSCSKTCGGGTQTYFETRTYYSAFDGSSCGVSENVNTGQTQACNTGSCCQYAAGKTWDFDYSTSGIQSFSVPCSGTYKLEVWGAEGGAGGLYDNDIHIDNYPGGKGGYSYGNISLTTTDTLYIGVGGKGGDNLNKCSSVREGLGGYNGGGYGAEEYGDHEGSDGDSTCDELWVWLGQSGGGGGATHIALNSNLGVLANYSSSTNRNSILIVAGGGGGAGSSKYIDESLATGEDEDGDPIYSEESKKMRSAGGSGGGYIGGHGYAYGIQDYNHPSDPEHNGAGTGDGGGQTAGGITWYTGMAATFGQGFAPASYTNVTNYTGHQGIQSAEGGGGGGGWYGGGAGGNYNGSQGGGGGSGYIGNSRLTNKGMYCFDCTTSTATNTKTTKTSNSSTIATSYYNKLGNGYARITLVSAD